MPNDVSSVAATWSVNDWAALAGVLGFALSLWLAASKLLANRLRIKLENIDFAMWYSEQSKERFLEFTEDRETLHILVTLTNKTSHPFSLIKAELRMGKHRAFNQRTAYTYRGNPKGGAMVEHAKLSTRFPLRFDSYETKEFFLSIRHPQIAYALLHPRPAPECNPEGLICSLLARICKLCTRQPRLRLKFRTSKGRRVKRIRKIDKVRDYEWIGEYSANIAAHEEKIVFSS